MTTTLWVGLKIIVLGLLIQPVIPILFVSPGTNDTRKPLVMLSVIIVSLTMIACGALFMLTWTTGTVILAGAAFGTLSVGALLLYGRMFNYNRFDLVPAPGGGI